MATVAIEESMNGSLREEVQLLRKKVVKLETAETDNEKLRKEISKIQKVHQNEKAQLEMDFMNQLTGVARENALRIEEMEGRLSESNKVNRAMSEQLADRMTEELCNKKLNELDALHRKEIVNIVDQNKADWEEMHYKLKSIKESRDDLATRLVDAQSALALKNKEMEALKKASSIEENKKETSSLQKLLTKAHEENAKLKCEMQEMKIAQDSQVKIAQDSQDDLTTKLNNTESGLNRVRSELNVVKSELESKQKEVETLKTESESSSIQKLLKETNQENTEILKELKNVHESRDELSTRLGDAESALATKRKEVESLKRASVEAVDSETSANTSMQRMLRKAHEDNAKLKSAIQHMETESLRKQRLHESEITAGTRDSEMNMKFLEREKMELKNATIRAEMESKRQELTVKQLERENDILKTKYKKLEMVNMSLHEKLKESTDSDSQNNANRKICCSGASEPPARNFQKSAHEKRTTQIIRQLEQNLKKEGQLKQSMTAGLKTRKLGSDVCASDNNVMANQDDPTLHIQEVQKQLEVERRVTANLRREVQDLKALYNSVQNKINDGDLSTAKGSPQTRKEKNGTVRGLAQSFERRISKQEVEPLTNRRATANEGSSGSVMQLRSTFEGKEFEELKDALNFERQAVTELEEELTRQCEINCSLLKEIGSLTTETESSRNMGAKHFETRCIADQREIEKMSQEISSLKSQLIDAEESKALLTTKFQGSTAIDKQEIQHLHSELSKLKVALSEAEETSSKLSIQLGQSVKSDKEEIGRLKCKIQELQRTLEETEQSIRTMEEQRASNEKELKQKQQLVEHLEKRLEAGNTESSNQKIRVEDLEKEIFASKELLATELQSKQHEIDGLNSLVDDLQSNLVDADKTMQALEKEKESVEKEKEKEQNSVRNLESQVEHLKKQLFEAEEKCEVLAKDQMSNMVDLDKEKESSGCLQTLVEDMKHKLSETEKKKLEAEEKCNALANDLAVISACKNELEQNEKTHHEQFDMLQAQVEEKVKQFEQTHNTDKEALGRLRDQVQSLQQELTNSLDQIETLQKQLRQRDEAEFSVEELARQNQHLYENKLQKERVDQVMEREEYKKKIKGLEETVESIQSEVDKRMEEKEHEVEDLKRRIENKDTYIGRLTMDKDQLVLSMNDMTSSRRNEIDELQGELMEMSTRSANQAREVQSLKLQLEDSNYRNQEVERLRARVVELGDQLRVKEGSRSQDKTALELENSDLRQKLRQSSLDRQGAEEKLRQYVEENKGGTSRTVQVLRERNTALKVEVEKLNRKLKKLYILEHRRQSYESQNSQKSVESTRLMI